MSCVAAVVQLTSGQDPEQNLARAATWIGEAAARGATLIALPENVAYLGDDGAGDLKRRIADAWFDRAARRLGELANTHRVTLIAGTLPEPDPDTARVFNTLMVFGPDGVEIARYRKRHLFDIALADGTAHRESATVSAGDRIAVARTGVGAIGLSVCYDLRFPEHYRALIDDGAEILAVPSAFTVPTGRDHWEVLLRARAIENLAYVIAPGQVGRHTPKRVTYGRSLIIDPWGVVLASAGDTEGVALASIDLDRVAQLRRQLPCLAHRRF